MENFKHLIKTPKIVGDKAMPRFTDTTTIQSGNQTEIIRKMTVNGRPYLVRSIFDNYGKTPTEALTKWINLDLKNND